MLHRRGMKNSALRKGAWSGEEDLLLRKCIEKYGEGNWHQVPLRAGLNRCRKSCRLRWLNYLSPKVNRGEFKEDEIDIIYKMHKLLGNRWSLIADRLSGRTANDIKNLWNSHLSKKQERQRLNNLRVEPEKIEVIKPRPTRPQQQIEEQKQEESGKEHSLLLPDEEQSMWWKDLVFWDEEMNQSSSVSMKEGSSSANSATETALALDSESVRFGHACAQWDDLLFE